MKGADRSPIKAAPPYCHRSTSNGVWISGILHCLNGTELYWKELQDNPCLRYGLMPQDIPATCDGFNKKFYIEHSP